MASLLRRAAQLPSGDMAADMCVDACWEKLHTGSWSEVPLSACATKQAHERPVAFAPGCNQMATMQVSVMWRNAYTAGSLLCAYKLAGTSAAQPAAHQAASIPESASGTPTSDSIAAISAAAAAHALRKLDMAALLGGPLFRPQLDACIASLQTSVSAECCRPPPSPGTTAGQLPSIWQQTVRDIGAWLGTS